MRFRKSEEAAQRAGAVIVYVRDRFGGDGGHYRHVSLGAAEDDVEPFLPATLVDGAEVHRHPAVAAGRVAHAHQDDVALVALHVLQVLHEKARELSVVLALDLAREHCGEGLVLGRQTFERILDLGLLRFGEGDDADGLPGFPPQQFTYQAGDVARFGKVGAAFVHPVGHAMRGDGGSEQAVDAAGPRSIVVRGDGATGAVLRAERTVGDRHQFACIECCIGKADQCLETAAIMPGEERSGQVPRRLAKQAVGIEHNRDALAIFLGLHFHILVRL